MLCTLLPSVALCCCCCCVCLCARDCRCCCCWRLSFAVDRLLCVFVPCSLLLVVAVAVALVVLGRWCFFGPPPLSGTARRPAISESAIAVSVLLLDPFRGSTRKSLSRKFGWRWTDGRCSTVTSKHLGFRFCRLRRYRSSGCWDMTRARIRSVTDLHQMAERPSLIQTATMATTTTADPVTKRL